MINLLHAFPRALRTHPLTSYILVDSFILPKPPDGLEPPYNDYKSLVLPLHQGDIYNFLISYINIISNIFLKIKYFLIEIIVLFYQKDALFLFRD